MAETAEQPKYISMSTHKDLTTEPPRSPRTRLGNYILLARALDKGRATLHSCNGEYHFDCPLDNFLFGFKGVKGDDVKRLLADGKSDEEIVQWLDTNGEPKTAEELSAWAAGVEAYLPYNDPEKKEWFIGECEAIGLDPKTSTLFDFLEADDKLVAAK
jgi:hypothetical protein